MSDKPREFFLDYPVKPGRFVEFDVSTDEDWSCYVEGTRLPGGGVRLDRVLYGDQANAAIREHHINKSRSRQMSDTLMIHYWMGRPLTDLTRDELVEALLETNRMLASEREMRMQSLGTLLDLGKRLTNVRDAG